MTRGRCRRARRAPEADRRRAAEVGKRRWRRDADPGARVAAGGHGGHRRHDRGDAGDQGDAEAELDQPAHRAGQDQAGQRRAEPADAAGDGGGHAEQDAQAQPEQAQPCHRADDRDEGLLGRRGEPVRHVADAARQVRQPGAEDDQYDRRAHGSGRAGEQRQRPPSRSRDHRRLLLSAGCRRTTSFAYVWLCKPLASHCQSRLRRA
ncbi:hypothetical protein [Frankia sp. QA3]|uniref:hypothetical protein n=1 Tax=Frankia sp. QA3 TaxID=710111 RepID=UPI0012F791B1|nr:hypothetical protein [Frankia sp. QA3]